MQLHISIRGQIALIVVSGVLACALALYALQSATPPASSTAKPRPQAKPDLSPLFDKLTDYLAGQQRLLLADNEKTLASHESGLAPTLLVAELERLRRTFPQWLDPNVMQQLRQGDESLISLRRQLTGQISQRLALEGQFRFLADRLRQQARGIVQLAQTASLETSEHPDLRQNAGRLPILLDGLLQADNADAMRRVAKVQLAPLLVALTQAVSPVSSSDGYGQLRAGLAKLTGWIDATDSAVIALAEEKRAAARQVVATLEQINEAVARQFRALQALVVAPHVDEMAEPTPAKTGLGLLQAMAVLLALVMVIGGVAALVRLRQVKDVSVGNLSVLPPLAAGEGQFGSHPIQQGKQSVRGLHDLYCRMNSSLQQISAETELQQETRVQISGAIEALQNAVRKQEASCAEIRQLVQQSTDATVRGEQVLRQSLERLHQVTESCDQIKEAVGSVDAIAFEINLLSLNATVEAAHAGDHGNGFSIVAAEVRNLAQRSTESAATIEQLIDQAITQVEAGQELVQKSNQIIESVAEHVSEADTAMSRMGALQEGKQDNIAVIRTGIDSLLENSQALREGLNGFHQVSEELDYHSHQLRDLIIALTGNQPAVTGNQQETAA